MSDNTSKEIDKGYYYALGAYICWGFFPIYWKLLQQVPSTIILAHRIIWAFALYSLILYFKNSKRLVFYPKSLNEFLYLTVASTLLMSNWFVYIYAVNSGQIVESSLGYFINPLVNILLGLWFLKEKLNYIQKLAVILACVGVVVIASDQLKVPWIALFLAGSFSLYGFCKKKTRHSSLETNQFESALFLIPAIFYVTVFSDVQIQISNYKTILLLAGSGLVTGIPLLLFSAAAKRIPYYMMGFFQFIAPSLQFLSGVLIFGESLSVTKFSGFVFIWGAGLLLLYTSWSSSKIRS